MTMKFGAIALLAAAALALGSMAMAKTAALTPANPQPGGPKAGLSVVYAYPADVETLGQARQALPVGAECGKALKGLD